MYVTIHDCYLEGGKEASTHRGGPSEKELCERRCVCPKNTQPMVENVCAFLNNK